MTTPASNEVRGAGLNGRPVVFFDITIGETPVGRIKFELFSDFTPKYVTQLELTPELLRTSASSALVSTGM